MTDPRIGTVLDDRYRLLDQLGSGGMGVVYRGERVKLGRNVAVKFLHAWMAADASFLKRFDIEARAMAKLQHPHCASVIDFGVDGDAPYVVMDLISGVSLRTLLDSERLAVPRALDIIRQVLSGLAHAHEQGITHRDIKPDNIMVDSSSAFGDQVRILDFGLAKLRESTSGLTTGFVVGTPSYMAPEQTMAEAVDERTDVYAAGVVLFEMLTGTPPFRADEMVEVLRMHREVPPPRLRDAAQDTIFSSELEAVIAQALAKKPAHRITSAAAFASALDAVPEATRVTTGERRALDSTTAMLSPSPGTSPGVSVDPQATTTLKPQNAPGPRPQSDPGATSSLSPAPWPAPYTPPPDANAATTAIPPGPPAGGSSPLPAGSLSASRAPGHRTRWAVTALAVAGVAAVLIIGLTGAGDPASTGADGLSPAPAPAASALPGSQPDELRDSPRAGRIRGAEPADSADDGPMAEDAIAAKIAAEPLAAPDNGPPELVRARALVRDGRSQQARKLLEKLRPRYRDTPELHFLLGRSYFDMLWCRDGIDSYRTAISLHPPYSSDPELVQSAIGGLANDKYHAQVARFITQQLGAAAIPALEQMAERYPRQEVRERAARTLSKLR